MVDLIVEDEWLAKVLENTKREARAAAFEEAARIVGGEAERLELLLPDGHGGTFAKKYAANVLYGAAAMIRKKAKE